MTKRRGRARGHVGAAAFKARCLELIDHVSEARVEYIVTRHGRPVAKLGPIDDTRTSGSPLNSMRGTLLKYDRPFAPIDAAWSIDRDDDDQT